MITGMVKDRFRPNEQYPISGDFHLGAVRRHESVVDDDVIRVDVSYERSDVASV